LTKGDLLHQLGEGRRLDPFQLPGLAARGVQGLLHPFHARLGRVEAFGLGDFLGRLHDRRGGSLELAVLIVQPCRQRQEDQRIGVLGHLGFIVLEVGLIGYRFLKIAHVPPDLRLDVLGRGKAGDLGCRRRIGQGHHPSHQDRQRGRHCQPKDVRSLRLHSLLLSF
jgi:hypothetical protein